MIKRMIKRLLDRARAHVGKAVLASTALVSRLCFALSRAFSSAEPSDLELLHSVSNTPRTATARS
eukprot:1856854-Rhodomonas_salina.1